MPRPERQQNVLDLLKGLRGIEPLKQLFWSELNYQRVNEPLSRRGWTDSASQALADDPILFAGGGENNDFHVIYGRLASDRLMLGNERPVVSRLVKEHPYALFVFSNKAQDRWHFLNVKYDDTAEKRRLFRRITVGPEERLRTASERLSLLSLDTISPELFGIAPLTIQQHHDEAFDVEAVTKQFFADFSNIFMRVAGDIKERNHGLDQEAIEQETQTLLNRLLFLYFVQRKGWLNRQRDYLYTIFQKHHAKDANGTTYYSEFLQRLFIKLSTEGEHLESLGDVPFLNGGLFADELGQQSTEMLRRTRMKVGNAVFRRVFDDLLERYNFTVREDTPLNQDVAIDPEMLGKIFESLVLQLEQSDTGGKTSRHDTGSYYTPRPIVHYLCREGLRAWLEQSPPSAKRASDWPQRLEKLLSLDVSDGIQPEERAVLDETLTPEEAQVLLDRLDDFRACDPAVGSGAFPVGLLHEVVNLRRLCETRARGKDPVAGDSEWLFNTKSQVIQRVLYGVDIQERAIEICKLRLWLSLMVDHPLEADVDNCSESAFRKALKNLPALPNLDYKIRRANSLIDQVRGHPVNLDRIPAEDKSLPPILNKLTSAKRAFYDAHKQSDKRRAKFDILDTTADLGLLEFKRSKLEVKDSLVPDEHSLARLRELDAAITELLALQSQIRAARKKSAGQQDEELERLGEKFDDPNKPTFVWQLDFAEVFHRKVGTGFDLVIGNPPYIPIEKILTSDREAFQLRYPELRRKFDSSAVFILRALELLTDDGAISFISSITWQTGENYGELRKTLFARAGIRVLVNLPFDVFAAAYVDTGVYILRKHCTDSYRICVLPKKAPIEELERAQFATVATSLVKGPDYKIILKPEVTALYWRLCQKSGVFPLGDITVSTQGLAGSSYPQIPRSARKEHLLFAPEANVQRYMLDLGTTTFADMSEHRSLIQFYEARPKVLIRRIINRQDRLVAVNTDQAAVFKKDINPFVIAAPALQSAYLLAIINSRLMSWLYINMSSIATKDDFRQTTLAELRKLPIRILDVQVKQERAEHDAMVGLVERVLAAKRKDPQADTGALEREIDERVYRLYGLTKDEIKLVEESGKKG